jgi:hypothetical protein
VTTNQPTAATVLQTINDALEMLRAVQLTHSEAANLVPLAQALKAAGEAAAIVGHEIKLRAEAGNLVPGAALKDEIKHRQWHDNEAASQLAREEFGDAAFSKPALLSPAQIEKLGERGKAFVAVASYKPECGKRVVY